MKDNSEMIETNVQLYHRHLPLFFGLLAVIGFLLFVLIDYTSINQMVEAVSAIIVIGFWLICLAYFVKKLTKKICFSFGKDFKVQIADPKDNNVIEEHVFDYGDIKSCMLSSGSFRTATCKLYFTNKKSVKFVLYSGEKPNEREDRIALGVFSGLYNMNNAIVPHKPFLLKPIGYIWLFIIVIWLLLDIVLHTIYKLGSNSFMSTIATTIGLSYILIGTRVNQKKLYNEMLSIYCKAKN
jgi:hypothetical protein